MIAMGETQKLCCCLRQAIGKNLKLKLIGSSRVLTKSTLRPADARQRRLLLRLLSLAPEKRSGWPVLSFAAWPMPWTNCRRVQNDRLAPFSPLASQKPQRLGPGNPRRDVCNRRLIDKNEIKMKFIKNEHVKLYLFSWGCCTLFFAIIAFLSVFLGSAWTMRTRFQEPSL